MHKKNINVIPIKHTYKHTRWIRAGGARGGEAEHPMPLFFFCSFYFTYSFFKLEKFSIFSFPNALAGEPPPRQKKKVSMPLHKNRYRCTIISR